MSFGFALFADVGINQQAQVAGARKADQLCLSVEMRDLINRKVDCQVAASGFGRPSGHGVGSIFPTLMGAVWEPVG